MVKLEVEEHMLQILLDHDFFFEGLFCFKY